MKRFKNVSIRTKILITMLVFTLIPVMLVSAVAIASTYGTMRDQLVYHYRTSGRWLQDRMNAELNDMVNQFYEFEVNKDIRETILKWCTQDKALDYEAKLEIIEIMYTTLNIDSSINSIELFNLKSNQVLVTERSGANIYQTGDRLDLWEQRDTGLQSNLVYLRDENEIAIYHLIHQFEINQPVALVCIRVRPYEMEEVLQEIKTTEEETVIVFNDQDEILEAQYGSEWDEDPDTVAFVRNNLVQGQHKEASFDGQFWFYRSAGNGKVQLLLSVPKRTIIKALLPTILTSVIVAILAVLASVVCSVAYSQAITKPIKKLSEKMKTTTLNEYAGHIAVDRKDEIGILQESFEYMISRNKELIAQQYQTKIEKRNAQLRALQAQINPHFMYNTLQVIGGMALERKAPEIYQITLALSDIMRYSLNFAKEMVPLAKEIEYLESYIMIQNERFGGKIHTVIQTEEKTLSCMIPKLILQPLVENSFEHGLQNKDGEWKITIESWMTPKGDLVVSIRDNGIGFQEDRLHEIQEKIESDTENALRSGSHIGLSNVHARIRLRYPEEKYGVKIESGLGAGTTVRVCMQAICEERMENHEL